LWDGKWNRVYATECSEGVLYYNDSSEAIGLDTGPEGTGAELKVLPKRFVFVPRRPSVHVLVFWEKGSGDNPVVKVLSGWQERAKWESGGVKVRANEPLRFKVPLPRAGRFRLFMRTLVGARLMPVRVQVGGGSFSPGSGENEGDFLFVGGFDFSEREVEITVSAGFDFVLEGFVFTDDLRVLGYRLAGIFPSTANSGGGITRP
jgi:hypothetical protein